MRSAIRFLWMSVLIPALAFAGSITGKVDAAPAKYLEETVVYVSDAKGTFPAKTAQIDQKGMKFLPHVVAITVGDTVDFLNHDGVDHNVFTPDGDKYNLGMVKPNGTGKWTFKAPGSFTQLCSVHPEMLGFIYVSPNPYHAVVDAKGAFKIDGVPAGTYKLAI